MATQCSVEWDESRLPAWGTAKFARVIIVVEAAGPWGRDAVSDAGLRAPSGATLYVVRSPGRHARNPQERQVFISGGFGASPWIVGGKLSPSDVSALLKSKVAEESTHDRFGLSPVGHGVLLVCTNGRRDACCAVRGRPVALAAHAAAPEGAWEVSHIGGHKLAPTALHLPSGQTFGRLSEEDSGALASNTLPGTLPEGLFSRTKHRGRVDLSPVQQVAETWWREQHPELSLAPVQVGPERKGQEGVEVVLPDGNRLLVSSHRGPDLRDSCAKLPKKSQYFTATLAS